MKTVGGFNEKKYLYFICGSSDSFSESISAKEYGGQHLRIGNGGGGYSTTFGGNSNEVFDRDNPDLLTSFLESKTAKANREFRKFVKGNIELIYSAIVPEYEQSNWRKDGEDIYDNGKYGSYKWVSKGEKDHILRITYEEISHKKYKNISDVKEEYLKELKSESSYKYAINIIEETKNSLVVEIERYERDVSDTLKKNTQMKFLEKWILNNGWHIRLAYWFNTRGEQEKNDSWNQLKSTWEERFSNISFKP